MEPSRRATIVAVLALAGTCALAGCPSLDTFAARATNDAGCDAQSDPANCGRCGHECGGGTCVDGACQPVALFPPIQGQTSLLLDIAIDDTYLFVTGGQGITRCELVDCAGTATDIYKGESSLVAVDDKYVYWATDYTYLADGGPANDAIVWRASKNGTGRQAVATGQKSIQTIAAGGGTVYWGDGFAIPGGSAIRGCPRDGCTNPFEVVSSVSRINTLLLDGPALYWSDWGVADGRGLVAKCEQALTGCGTAPIVLAPDLGEVRSIAIDGASVFVAVYADRGNAAMGSIRRMDRDGKNVTALLTTTSGPTGVGVDPTFVYWTNYGSGTVMRAPKTGGGKTEPIATNQVAPRQLLVHEGFLYWANGDGSVMRLTE